MEARRDVARAQAALRVAAAEAEAAVAAAQEAARELEGALARIADVRDPEALGDTAPAEHADAVGRPPAQAASSARESQGVASEESAQEAQEEAVVEGAEELGEDFYAEALGDATACVRHDLVANFFLLYDDDAELGAAVRRCWGEIHGDLIPSPRRSSRPAPYLSLIHI